MRSGERTGMSCWSTRGTWPPWVSPLSGFWPHGLWNVFWELQIPASRTYWEFVGVGKEDFVMLHRNLRLPLS